MDLLHAAPFQGIIPRPYLKGIVNGENLDLVWRQRGAKRRLFSTSDSFFSFLFVNRRG